MLQLLYVHKRRPQDTMKSSIKQLGLLLFLATMTAGLSGCTKNTDVSSINKESAVQEQNTQDYHEEFENFLKKHGEEITLETVDTTNWKEYTDTKRGFSFKYPEDWYVIPIDFSHFPEDDQRPEIQKMYKKERGWGIKSQTESDPFLCMASDTNHKQMPQRLLETMPDTSSIHNKYCDILFNEYRVRWNGEKRTSGELWVEHYLSIDSDSKFLKYIVNNSDTYVYSGNTLLRQFKFISQYDIAISVAANNPLKRELSNEVYPTFDTLLQTIKHTE